VNDQGREARFEPLPLEVFRAMKEMALEKKGAGYRRGGFRVRVLGMDEYLHVEGGRHSPPEP